MNIHTVQQGVEYYRIKLSIELVKYQSFIGVSNIWGNIGLGSHQGSLGRDRIRSLVGVDWRDNTYHTSRYMVFSVTAKTHDLHREGDQQAGPYRNLWSSGNL